MTQTNLITFPDTLTRSEFRKVFSHIYENSPWVCEAVWEAAKSGRLNSREAMSTAMKRVVDTASDEQKLVLLLEHPELGGDPALNGGAGPVSLKEQKRIGLTDPSNAQVQQLRKNNIIYRKKFSFPFIVAVADLTIDDIHKIYEKRIRNSYTFEFSEAVRQTHRIASFRLMEMSDQGGYLNCKKI